MGTLGGGHDFWSGLRADISQNWFLSSSVVASVLEQGLTVVIRPSFAAATALGKALLRARWLRPTPVSRERPLFACATTKALAEFPRVYRL